MRQPWYPVQELYGLVFAAFTIGIGVGPVMLGIGLAWLYRIEWSAVSQRLADWLKVQRRRLAWALLGSICAAILIYF